MTFNGHLEYNKNDDHNDLCQWSFQFKYKHNNKLDNFDNVH